MNESVLKALMQLFAVVAQVDGINDKSKSTVSLFLLDEVGVQLSGKYLDIYDEFIQKHHFRKNKKDGKVKQTSRNAVKILRIASEINKTLTRQQKLVVLIRVIEYIYSQDNLTELNLEFLQAIVDAFNVDQPEYKSLLEFVKIDQNGSNNENDQILICGKSDHKNKQGFSHSGLTNDIVFINLPSSKVIAFKSIGETGLNIDGNPIKKNKIYLFRRGASIRGSQITPIYYSDVLSKFTNNTIITPVVFDVNEITYHFENKDIGLHQISFQASSGNLVGIMGGSGTGKSTLLNVLNGNYSPSSGNVSVNGISIHTKNDSVNGLIGYVPQDDLLMEDLTVFQNLYFNAQLIFGDLTNFEILKRVESTLLSLGLYETRDLKVGSALEKTISGGQRKRLNIALELIREPSIMFVDEPTSGLSSRDSENIMDLLKELTLKGKLIFVVIHQPSSDIFKMFDKLLIMDRGGYLIYQGNPLEGISYFQSASGQITGDIGSYVSSGNVNPEQIFDVIEAKLVDEYGDLTNQRRRQPKEWHRLFEERLKSGIKKLETPSIMPVIDFSIPNFFKQLKVFTQRDLLSKISNKQYMVVNLLEAPVLAIIIAGFLRYIDPKSSTGEYVFRDNTNLIAYLFISVVVAIFLGLSVSAEEIIKDRKIRKRESFLNLSRGGYLTSKITIQFTISAIQMLSYVIIGNLLMGIEGMNLTYWLVLFSAACTSNLIGLNISASFKNVVTIYILIPFIIIPQILFSGVLVKYDQLNPWFSATRGIPIIGNVMASRWTFEALVVEQVAHNKYEKKYFEVNKLLYHYLWMKNFWIPEIDGSISALKNEIGSTSENSRLNYELNLIKSEFNELPKKETEALTIDMSNLSQENITRNHISALQQFSKTLNDYYGRKVNRFTQQKDEITAALRGQYGGDKELLEIRNNHENKELWEYVNNKKSITKIKELDGELFRNENLLYMSTEEGINHLYGEEKSVFGKIYTTLWFNISILWFMTLIFITTLYFNLPRLAYIFWSRIKFSEKDN
ncbi:MAG: ATP-binding cassette domain-containing protein [Salibacteraceae bacterium]